MLIEDMSKVIEYADDNTVVEDEDNEVEFYNINSSANAFNEDIVIDSYDRDEILKNREGGEKGYFVIRKK